MVCTQYSGCYGCYGAHVHVQLTIIRCGSAFLDVGRTVRFAFNV